MSLPSPPGSGTFTNPLPGPILGDPFVLRHRGRFYLYGTNDGPPLADGREVPVFRSDDLIHWEPLGGALEPAEPGADHWAPEVLPWNGKFYMVVSFGDVEARGHALWVAVADRPEGPFRLRARVSDPGERFAIDGAWLLDDEGRLYLFHCLDFVAEEDPPHGTGIVARPMRDPLTPAGPPVTILRAHAPWHLFQANRPMALYGGWTFPEWTTIEGAAPVKRAGRYFCGYSGGNYTGAYGTGEVVADAPLGPYTDPRGKGGPIFGTVPGLVEGPGHFSVIRPDLVRDWIVLHGRRPGQGWRGVWLCPASWDAAGVTIGPLTDRPQPAPPLPTHRWPAADRRDLAGWRPLRGALAPDGEGLRLAGDDDGDGLARWDGIDLPDSWVAEAWVQAAGGGAAGFALGGEGERATRVVLRPSEGRCEAGRDVGPPTSAPLPTLGEIAFDPAAFHALEIRARDGSAEVRIDGVVVVRGLELPPAPRWLGLVVSRAAGGPQASAIFDAIALTTGLQNE